MNKLSTVEWRYSALAVPRLRSAFKIGVVGAGLIALVLWLPPREAGNQAAGNSYTPEDSAPALRGTIAEAPVPQQAIGTGELGREVVPAEQLVVAAEQVTSSARIAGSSAPQRLASAESANASGVGRDDLVRALQRELNRVGCYSGDIDGDWGPGSKRAMSAFIDRVNASLPVEEPDYILLSLVKGHKGLGCRERSAGSAQPGQIETARLSDAGSAGAAENVQAARRLAPAPRSLFRPANEKTWTERVFSR